MSRVFSKEDGSLSTSIRVVRERTYSDIDLSFSARTATDGDIYRRLDANAVKQAVRTLILTSNYEKPYRPNFGANLGSLLFNLMDEATGYDIINAIKKAIERYEPRIRITNIKVIADTDTNAVSVTLEFRIVSTNEVAIINVPLDVSAAAAAAATAPPTTTMPIFTNGGGGASIPVTPPPIPRASSYTGVVFTNDNPTLYDENGNEIIRYLIGGGLSELIILFNQTTQIQGSILTVPDENELATQDGLILVVQNYPGDSKFSP